jgi:choline kinase
MRAIIIGAGRGSRLMPTTENAPKCFAEIQGKRILDWTVEALRGGGCTEICFIGGYRIEAVRRDYPDFIFRENRDWQDNNILVSLMCAEDLMDRPFVAAYSDILFTRQVVADLVCSSEELVLGVDTDWREHYRPRTQHPPPDAEKVITRNGRVECVHRGISYEAALFQKAYLIHMFQDMIEHGMDFGHADTPGHYREIDTQQDMDLAQTLWKPPT